MLGACFVIDEIDVSDPKAIDYLNNLINEIPIQDFSTWILDSSFSAKLVTEEEKKVEPADIEKALSSFSSDKYYDTYGTLSG